MMTLKQALEHFEGKADLARALGVSRQAISNWDEDKPIPGFRELQLKYEILPSKKAKKRNSKSKAA